MMNTTMDLMEDTRLQSDRRRRHKFFVVEVMGSGQMKRDDEEDEEEEEDDGDGGREKEGKQLNDEQNPARVQIKEDEWTEDEGIDDERKEYEHEQEYQRVQNYPPPPPLELNPPPPSPAPSQLTPPPAPSQLTPPRSYASFVQPCSMPPMSVEPMTAKTAPFIVSTKTSMPVVVFTPPKVENPSLVPNFLPSNTLISSMFRTTNTALPNATGYVPTPDVAGNPRKGLDPKPTILVATTSTAILSMSTATQTIIVAQTEVASNGPSIFAMPVPVPERGDRRHHDDERNDDRTLSEPAEHLLIAMGAIGAFIIFSAFVYFFFVMRRRKDSMGYIRERKLGKGGQNGWYRWRKDSMDDGMDAPPNYHQGASYAPQLKLKTSFGEKNISQSSPVTAPSSAAVTPRLSIGRRESSREGLLQNAASFAKRESIRDGSSKNAVPFGSTPSSASAELPESHKFYNSTTQQSSYHTRQISETYDPAGSYGNQKLNFDSTGTLGTYNSLNSSEAYDSSQREVNRISNLSSLSSGFGDGLVMLEPSVIGTGANGARRDTYRRQSETRGGPRFSWVPSQPRDTLYTNSSADTAPRFRTVNSWVAQQSGQVERKLQSDKEIPPMPAIPRPLQAIGHSTAAHQQSASENAVFNYHPGDEVALAPGSRFPSSVLERQMDVKRRSS